MIRWGSECRTCSVSTWSKPIFFTNGLGFGMSSESETKVFKYRRSGVPTHMGHSKIIIWLWPINGRKHEYLDSTRLVFTIFIYNTGIRLGLESNNSSYFFIVHTQINPEAASFWRIAKWGRVICRVLKVFYFRMIFTISWSYNYSYDENTEPKDWIWNALPFCFDPLQKGQYSWWLKNEMWVLYISTSVWVLRTPKAGLNSHFQCFSW